MSIQSCWVQTYSGRAFYPFDPAPNQITARDIAWALSMKCRYNGHSNSFYSVAQHSILVSEQCAIERPGDTDYALWGLLHDGAEAYLPDVPRPLKPYMPGFVELETKIMRVIADCFRLSWPEPPGVKRIDTAILVDEALVLMGDISGWQLPEPRLGIPILPMDQREAFGRFMCRFSDLFGIV